MTQNVGHEGAPLSAWWQTEASNDMAFRQRSATDGKQRAGHREFQKDAQGSGGRGSLQEDLSEEHARQGACRKT